MKPLKEATHIKHKEVERMPFNVKMFKGHLTKEQYGWYLRSQLGIFRALEDNFEFPHEGLKRIEAVAFDLMSLGINELVCDIATREYAAYLKRVISRRCKCSHLSELLSNYVWWTDDEESYTWSW